MTTIRLNAAEWTYDEGDPLGPAGGFGEVFRGEGAAGPVAVKRLKLTASAAAHREMDIGLALSTRRFGHVVPVLDFGQDSGSESYFLVMPICDRSLQDEMASQGVLMMAEAKAVALDVLAGLQEVEEIVHRDLKPGNVLMFEGSWRLADFGIAKFVEDSTSLRTLRGSLTPAYGAPEQWNGERPTHATDVYALGCMFHTMLNGAPPFGGTMDDIRESHLHRPPPPLGVDSRLDAFVGQMLRKVPALRPTIDRCIQVIGSVGATPQRPIHHGLQAVAGEIAQQAAAAEAVAQAAATAERERLQLVREATSDLDAIVQRLFDEITRVSEEARSSRQAVSLGRGTLTFGGVKALAPSLPQDGYGQSPEWEVAAEAKLSITRAAALRPSQTPTGASIVYAGRMTSDDRPYTWSATLFFGRSKRDAGYRWRETAFFQAWTNGGGQNEPYAISPDDRDFQLAFSNVVGIATPAYGPIAIDGEDEDSFIDRWLTLFAKAASGKLSRPDRMPLPDHSFR